MSVVHDDHVCGGGWLTVVGGGDVAQDMVPEAAQRGHTVDPCPRFPRHGVVWGGAVWGMGHVWLVIAGAALGVQPPRRGMSDKVSPPVDCGHPDSVPCGGRALADRGGEHQALVSANLEEGVEEELSDTFPQNGCLDQGGRRELLGGAKGVEARHLLVSEAPEVLLYCCGVVEGVGLGPCAAGGATCGEGAVWAMGGLAGSGDGVSLGHCEEGGLVVVRVGGGWGWWELVGVSARCVSGPVPASGKGGDGVGVALLVAGGAGPGAVLEKSPGVTLGPVGVACVCRAVLTVPGWPRCPGGRWLPGHPGGTVVRRQLIAADGGLLAGMGCS